jgi:hypothetical protein
VKPATGSLSKGDAVEEWVDLKFFRPVGGWIARSLAATGVTADQVTLAALGIGIVAGHLFLYSDRRLDFLGFLLFILSDILDSADGQLARLRGTTTRWGRIVDGLADSFRWTNLYIHLILRLFLARFSVGGEAIAFAALVAHSFQSGGIDLIRCAYLEVAERKRREVDLPEDLSRPRGRRIGPRIADALYGVYVRRQSWMFPNTLALIRVLRGRRGGSAPDAAARTVYRDRQDPIVRACAWLGHNIRFALLGVLPWIGGAAGFCWITVVPMSLLLIVLVVRSERNALALATPAGARAKAVTP